ncbi:hypothetical protein EIP91_009426 [Steccherinum ochraceum]|uniref:Uncharacterized protein n=1 Tax=Steccherinum ochraceum TaxID=92696 RepID=A0A4R0R4A4_9APHY|nr:hypothetical protein EIP91_009426 [Steccherinum ochraceum]
MSYSPSSSIPSSPASSPSFGPIDSSPPSSPSTPAVPLGTDFDSPPSSPGVVHPFAGSTKAIKRFKLYEKREGRWGAELNDEDDGDCDSTRLDLDASTTAYARTDTDMEDFEDEVESTHVEEFDMWERRISDAIDQGKGLLDLSSTSFGGAITYIPPSIADLEKLVVLPEPSRSSRLSPAPASVTSSPTKPQAGTRKFARAVTAPVYFSRRGAGDALFSSSHFGLGAGKSISSPSVARLSGPTLNEVQLYIANHSIRSLPTELFWLSNLTVLSLRGNKLTTLPPQIATSLPHLRELNVSLNELEYLPSEILGLRLESLSVAGNPWLPPPKETAQPKGLPAVRVFRGLLHNNGPLHMGAVVRHFSVPPLSEACLRVLMAPAVPAPHTRCLASREPIPVQTRELTVLESKYEVPLVRSDYTPVIVDAVDGCIPRSITDQRKNEWSTKIQASPSKKARTGRSPYHDDSDPFISDIPTQSPFSRKSSSQPRTRTKSHTSVFSTHSRSSTSRVAIEPPRPALSGISVCPSPRHLGQMGKPVYVRHAVERLTWEEELAGVKMGEADGVPVLWRGCGPCCLAWLDEDQVGEDAVQGGGAEEQPDTIKPALEEPEVAEFTAVDLSGGLADAFYDSDG